MAGPLSLAWPTRHRLVWLDRKAQDADLRIRCRVVLKVTEGMSCAAVARALNCVASTTAPIVARFRRRVRRIARLKRLAAHRSPQEALFYADEMDIHLNPQESRAASGSRRASSSCRHPRDPRATFGCSPLQTPEPEEARP